MDANQEVAAANARYYQAFESSDLDAMSAVWERSERAVCTHPGWSTLRGWSEVVASYFALFQRPADLQFLLTREQVTVSGPTAWVSVDENLLGEDAGVTVAALNVFARGPDGTWLLVVHHGSAVQASLS